MHRHAVFPQRTHARIKVLLRETAEFGLFEHEVMLRVWVDLAPGDGPEALRNALLERAAVVLRRTFATADRQPMASAGALAAGAAAAQPSALRA